MTPQPTVQAILNVEDGLFGLRHLRIVRSPVGKHFVVDVMFKHGLRLTSNIEPGHPVDNIGKELDQQAQFYRQSDYNNIKPAIDFAAECVSRVLTDKNGKVAECQLDADMIKEAWEMTRFRRLVKTVDGKRRLDFETASEDLKAFYNEEPATSWSSDV